MQVQQKQVQRIQMPEGRGQFHNLVDILFVLDMTGSMGWCIATVSKTIRKIIDKFRDRQFDICFAFCLYKDHPPQDYSYVFKHFDLMSHEQTHDFIANNLKVAGGGDFPEAVMDGLYEGLRKTSWRIGTDNHTISKRFLFHACDAPPHGIQYGSSSQNKQWQQKGCPCGVNRNMIAGLLTQYRVEYNLVKCGQSIEKMQELFRESFGGWFKKVLEIKQGQKGMKRKRKLSTQFKCEEDLMLMQGDQEHHKAIRKREYSDIGSQEDQSQEQESKGQIKLKRKLSVSSMIADHVEEFCQDFQEKAKIEE